MTTKKVMNMHTHKRLILTNAKKLSVIVLFSFLLNNQAHACSCVNPTSESFYEGLTSVFVGKMIKKKSALLSSERQYTFDVTQKVKGHIPEQLTLSSNKSSASCGYNYEKGIDYLVAVYQSKGNKKYYSGLCSSWPLSSRIGQDVLQKINNATQENQ